MTFDQWWETVPSTNNVKEAARWAWHAAQAQDAERLGDALRDATRPRVRRGTQAELTKKLGGIAIACRGVDERQRDDETPTDAHLRDTAPSQGGER